MNLRLPAPKAGALPGCATPRSERDPLACLFSRCKPLKRLGSYKAGKLEGQKAWRLGSMHALMLLDFSVIRLSSLPAFQPPSLPAYFGFSAKKSSIPLPMASATRDRNCGSPSAFSAAAFVRFPISIATAGISAPCRTSSGIP